MELKLHLYSISLVTSLLKLSTHCRGQSLDLSWNLERNVEVSCSTNSWELPNSPKMCAVIAKSLSKANKINKSNTNDLLNGVLN